jgi:hypothetical protein
MVRRTYSKIGGQEGLDVKFFPQACSVRDDKDE